VVVVTWCMYVAGGGDHGGTVAAACYPHRCTASLDFGASCTKAALLVVVIIHTAVASVAAAAACVGVQAYDAAD
jgi:hypothetical protein